VHHVTAGVTLSLSLSLSLSATTHMTHMMARLPHELERVIVLDIVADESPEEIVVMMRVCCRWLTWCVHRVCCRRAPHTITGHFRLKPMLYRTIFVTYLRVSRSPSFRCTDIRLRQMLRAHQGQLLQCTERLLLDGMGRKSTDGINALIAMCPAVWNVCVSHPLRDIDRHALLAMTSVTHCTSSMFSLSMDGAQPFWQRLSHLHIRYAFLLWLEMLARLPALTHLALEDDPNDAREMIAELLAQFPRLTRLIMLSSDREWVNVHSPYQEVVRKVYFPGRLMLWDFHWAREPRSIWEIADAGLREVRCPAIEYDTY
jgi:hypothetical protein